VNNIDSILTYAQHAKSFAEKKDESGLLECYATMLLHLSSELRNLGLDGTQAEHLSFNLSFASVKKRNG